MGRIAIIGVGAIGGVTAALLHTTGRHQLILCTRRPMPELIVKTGEGVIAAKLHNLTDPAGSAEPVDWVLVATKVYDAGTAVYGCGQGRRRPAGCRSGGADLGQISVGATGRYQFYFGGSARGATHGDRGQERGDRAQRNPTRHRDTGEQNDGRAIEWSGSGRLIGVTAGR